MYKMYIYIYVYINDLKNSKQYYGLKDDNKDQ